MTTRISVGIWQAELSAHGLWVSDNAALTKLLNVRFPVERSPWNPNPNATAAYNAASALRGKVLETDKVKPHVKGRIY